MIVHANALRILAAHLSTPVSVDQSLTTRLGPVVHVVRAIVCLGTVVEKAHRIQMRDGVVWKV